MANGSGAEYGQLTGASEQFLTFFLSDEEYAVPILRVKEIIAFGNVTRVPSTPPWIRGVINLRGSVVPVVDMAVKFGLAPTQPTKLTCTVVVETEFEGRHTITGVMADSVNEVVELKASDIEAVPSFGTDVNVAYLLGMGKAGRKFVMLLDIDRVLASSELLAVKAPGPLEAQAQGADRSVTAEGSPEAPLDDAGARRKRRKQNPEAPLEPAGAS